MAPQNWIELFSFLRDGRCDCPLCVLLFSILLVSVPFAKAQSGDLETTVRLGTELSHETNPTRDPDTQRKNSEALFRPGINTLYTTPTSSLLFDFEGEIVRSSDETVRANVVNYSGDLEATQDFEESSLSAVAVWSFLEFENSGFDDDELLSSESSSQTSQDEQVANIDLDVTYERQYSELTRYSTIFGAEASDFSGGTGDDFLDLSVDLRGEHDITQNLSLSGQVGYRVFDAQGQDEQNTLSLQFGSAYEIDPSSSIDVSFGGRDLDGEQGYVFDLTYSRAFERSNIDLTAFRNLSSSADQGLRETTGGTFSYDYLFSDTFLMQTSLGYQDNTDVEAVRLDLTFRVDQTEFLSFGANLSQIESESDNNGVQSTSSESTINPFASWTISEEFQAQLRYFEIFEQQSDVDDVHSRRVTLQLNYTAPVFN